MFWPTIFDPGGSLCCNALAVNRMTQSKLWKGSLPVLHIYIHISKLNTVSICWSCTCILFTRKETKVTSDPLSMSESSDSEVQVGSAALHVAFQAPALIGLRLGASLPWSPILVVVKLGLVCPDCGVARHWVGPAINAPMWLYHPSVVTLPKWWKRKTKIGQLWTPCTLYFR